MSVPTEYSTYCRKNDCGSYNVDGYCQYHLVRFFNWLKKGKLELTDDNYEKLWEEFEKND